MMTSIPIITKIQDAVEPGKNAEPSTFPHLTPGMKTRVGVQQVPHQTSGACRDFRPWEQTSSVCTWGGATEGVSTGHTATWTQQTQG